jgi:hypothetical protein
LIFSEQLWPNERLQEIYNFLRQSQCPTDTIIPELEGAGEERDRDLTGENRMNLKSILHGVLAITFFFSNVLAAHSTETNFWSDRRAQAKRQYTHATGQRTAIAGDSNSSGSTSLLLAQLPGAQAIGFDGPNYSHVGSAPLKSVNGIQKEELSAARAALAQDGSADWLDPIVNPFGTVRDIHLSQKSDSPLIIHIQDVHGYLDAQQNIAGLIEGLSKYRGVNLVGMEAAEGAFALEDLRQFPDQDIKERVTNWAIKKDLIGGAEKAGIISEHPLTLWGVENTALYESNVQAVKDSLARRTEAMAFHKQFMTNVNLLKKTVYSENLKKYDENLLAYQDKRRGLGDYLSHLADQYSDGHKGLAKRFPNTAKLLDALDQESKLDFKQVERERVSLVEVLATRLNEKELNGLVKESLAYRAGRVTYSRYYAYVKTLCRQAHIDLDKYPALTNYIAYVGLSEKINRVQLLNELERLEDAVAVHLARTDLERGVLALSRDSILLGKLMNNAMTPEDWERYVARHKEIVNSETRAKSFARDAGVTFETKFPQDFVQFVKPFEEFCRLALARNKTLTDGLFAKMGEEKLKTAIVVAGGFHTDGMMAEIERQGGSYVVLTPRVEIIQSDKNYLDAFAHDPVPLEKLFDGETISILTGRTTTAAAAEIPGGVSGIQKIGLAMVAHQVSEWFSQLLRDHKPLSEIQNTLETRLESLLSTLGSTFKGMTIHLRRVSQNNFVLAAKVAGTNLNASGFGNETKIRVAMPHITSYAGLENAYTEFAQTKFGAWLKGFNLWAFQSVAEIFFAPGVEKAYTGNLNAFRGNHDFSNVAFSPLESVISSLGGWLSVATMGLAGFSPTLAAFYFTFIDPAGFFSTSLGLILFATVTLVNYAYRTDFYVVPHSFVNAIIIGMNVILATLNIFFRNLTFRFARLTLSDLHFFSSRGIDNASIEKFRKFIDGYRKDAYENFPNTISSRFTPGFMQLVHILAVEASKANLTLNNNDELQHELVAHVGELIIRKLENGSISRLFMMNKITYSNLITQSQSNLYKTAPPFEPETSGISMSSRLNNSTSDYPFAQVYDEWIRRCYVAASLEKRDLFDVNKNNKIWLDLLNNLQSGRFNSGPSLTNESKFTHGEPVTQNYAGHFQIVMAPGKFEVVLNVYSKNDLPEGLKDRIDKERIVGDFYLIRNTPYGDYIMGISENGGTINIGLNDGGFVTVVEASSISHKHLTVSVKGNILTINNQDSANGTALRTSEKPLTERGKQIKEQIGAARTWVISMQSLWDDQNYENKMNVANHYWGLKMLARNYRNVDELTSDLALEGVSPQDVKTLLHITGDMEILNRFQTFDIDNLQNLVALSDLFSVAEKNTGYANIDLDRAKKGLDIIQIFLLKKKAPGFSLENTNRYFLLRFGSLRGIRHLTEKNLGPLLTENYQTMGNHSQELMLQTATLRKYLEIAVVLFPQSPPETTRFRELNNNDFEAAVRAYEALWNLMDSKFPHDAPNVQEFSDGSFRFVTVFLLKQGFRSDHMLVQMRKFLLNRTNVENSIRERRVRVLDVRAKQEPIQVDFEVNQNNGRNTRNDERVRLNDQAKDNTALFVAAFFGKLRQSSNWNGKFIHQLLSMYKNKIILSIFSSSDHLNGDRISVTDSGIVVQMSVAEFNQLSVKNEIPGFEFLIAKANRQAALIKEWDSGNITTREQLLIIRTALHPDKGILFPRAEEIASLANHRLEQSRFFSGSWGIWKSISINSVAGAVFEAVFYLAGATFLANWLIPVGELSLEMMIPLLFDVTGMVFLALFVIDFLVHFFGGVGQAVGQPSVTIWNDGVFPTAKAAFRATITATNNAYMLPFVVAALLIMPFASAGSLALLVIGFALGAYKHAMANYRIELSSVVSHPAEGVTVMATPLTAQGTLAPAPETSLLGMLKFAFAGGKAQPQYDGLAQAVYQVTVTQNGLLAAKSDPLSSATLTTQPDAWVAQQALANQGEKDPEAMQPLMAFLNMAVFFGSHIGEMEKTSAPDAPILIEVPNAQTKKENPMAMQALASVVMASMETTNRPLALVSKDETVGADQQDIINEVRTLLQTYSPVAANKFSTMAENGQIQAILAGETLFKDGKFQLQTILDSAYKDQGIDSAIVFGDETHFDSQGIQTVVFNNYLSLAESLLRIFQERALFAIQA